MSEVYLIQRSIAERCVSKGEVEQKRKSPTDLSDRRAFPFCASGAEALRLRYRGRDHATLGIETVALGIVTEAVLVPDRDLMAAGTGRHHLRLLIHRVTRLRTRRLPLVVTRARLGWRADDLLGAGHARDADQGKREQGMSDHFVLLQE